MAAVGQPSMAGRPFSGRAAFGRDGWGGGGRGGRGLAVSRRDRVLAKAGGGGASCDGWGTAVGRRDEVLAKVSGEASCDGWGTAISRRDKVLFKGGGSDASCRPRYLQPLPRARSRESAPRAASPSALAAHGVVATMTPTQEVLNALTMLLPLAVALQAIAEEQAAPGKLLVAAAIAIHFPFSFCYHLSCAVFHGRVHPVENNLGLKGDVIFIHVAGTLMALATSGSLLYFAGLAAFNGVVVCRTATWSNTVAERQLCRLACVLGYMLPILLIDMALFACGILTFLVVAASFACNGLLGGWGHALSHVLLVPVAMMVFSAAALVPAPYC